MELYSRREFLKMAGGAGAGLMLGPLLAARNGRPVFSAGGLKFTVAGGFVRLSEPGRIVVRALSLEPSVKLLAGAGAPDRLKIEITNVRASQTEIKCEGLKVLSRSGTAIEAELPLAENRPAAIETSYRPLPGERLNFIAFSDTHLGVPEAEEHFGRVMKHTNLRRPLFAVDAGDIVDFDEQKQWDIFEERATGLKVPLFTTIGNHDSYVSTKLYRKYLGDLFYSLKVGETQFLFLDNSQKYNNATLFMDGENPNEQWDWLAERLKEPADHRIVFFHFPVYGTRSMMDPMYMQSTPPEERKKEVDRMMKMFGEAKVEYICNGHIHNHGRKEIDGIVHLQLGGGGGSKASETADEEVGFTHFFIDENGIRDYTVFLYYKPEEVERMEFCEARSRLPAGAREPLIAHGVAKDRLLGIEPAFEIISGPGRIVDETIYSADTPGRAKISAKYGKFTTSREIEIF